MKSFASALLFAGANAAAAAIDFGAAAKVDMAKSSKLSMAAKGVTDETESVAGLFGKIEVTYTLATDIAAKQFSLTGGMVLQHKGALTLTHANFGMWQCWKRAMSNDAIDMSCFVWEYKAMTGNGAAANKGTIFSGIWKTASTSAAVTTAKVNVTTAADMPVKGSNAFANNTNWTPLYALNSSADATFTNTATITLTAAAVGNSTPTYSTTGVDLASKPTMTLTAWG